MLKRSLCYLWWASRCLQWPQSSFKLSFTSTRKLHENDKQLYVIQRTSVRIICVSRHNWHSPKLSVLWCIMHQHCTFPFRSGSAQWLSKGNQRWNGAVCGIARGYLLWSPWSSLTSLHYHVEQKPDNNQLKTWKTGTPVDTWQFLSGSTCTSIFYI